MLRSFRTRATDQSKHQLFAFLSSRFRVEVGLNRKRGVPRPENAELDQRSPTGLVNPISFVRLASALRAMVQPLFERSTVSSPNNLPVFYSMQVNFLVFERYKSVRDDEDTIFSCQSEAKLYQFRS
jgi:hypothetical protein